MIGFTAETQRTQRFRWLDAAMALLAGLAVAFCLAGCASPLIDEWADRGLAGIGNARQNVLAFSEARQGELGRAQAADINAVFADLKRLAVAPADPNAPGAALTPADLDNMRASLALLLAANRADEKALTAATNKALANLDQTAECFAQIKRLRTSWGTDAEIDARLAHLTTLVTALLQERRSTP